MEKVRFGFKDLSRALRLPFLSVSVLPFIAGSLLARSDFYPFGFIVGLFAVIATHLGANLINDYADSKSGVDWKDKDFYGFFGGSKLIQEGVLSEEFYLKTALIFLALAAALVSLLAFLLQGMSVIVFFAAIAFLAWAYSAKPFQLSHRGLGEAIVFILFGPALVMGGFFIQTLKIFATQSVLLSLSFGLFATAVLFANEVPDLATDQAAGKNTLVSFMGKDKAFILYYCLIIAAYIFIFLSIVFECVGAISFFSFLGVFPAFKAADILRLHPDDKSQLLISSKLTVMTHTISCIFLVLGVIL